MTMKKIIILLIILFTTNELMANDIGTDEMICARGKQVRVKNDSVSVGLNLKADMVRFDLSRSTLVSDSDTIALKKINDNIYTDGIVTYIIGIDIVTEVVQMSDASLITNHTCLSK